jgi:hypothetical protein
VTTTAIDAKLIEAPAAAPWKISDAPAWLLALVPAAGPAVEKLLGLHPSPEQAFWTYCLLNTALILADTRTIGHRLGRWFWLTPLYLFKRARALGHSLCCFWIWFACMFGGFVIDSLDEVVGVPTCQSGFAHDNVLAMFERIPRIAATGLSSVKIRDQAETSLIGDTRACRAVVEASDGKAYSVTYTMEWTKRWTTRTRVALGG